MKVKIQPNRNSTYLQQSTAVIYSCATESGHCKVSEEQVPQDWKAYVSRAKYNTLLVFLVVVQ